MSTTESLKGLIQGYHHVTATVGDAQEDLHFYTHILGLRLVKQTVNFDNQRVYHFYYADRSGNPSTVFTTFPYKKEGVRKGKIGTGQVGVTAFSTSSDGLLGWKSRFESYKVDFKEIQIAGFSAIEFADPSGLSLRIVGDDADERNDFWSNSDIDTSMGIKGIHHVHLFISSIKVVEPVLLTLGFKKGSDEKSATNTRSFIYFIEYDGKKSLLVIDECPEMEKGLNGIGTVHHVAWCVDSVKDSMKIREQIRSKFGVKATEVKDRKYFESVYFRIPGGILFELATKGPGFMVDETIDNLGRELKLPEWQEESRAEIEANLDPVYF